MQAWINKQTLNWCDDDDDDDDDDDEYAGNGLVETPYCAVGVGCGFTKGICRTNLHNTPSPSQLFTSAGA